MKCLKLACALALLPLLVACADTSISVRYAAEKDLWAARRMGVRIQSQPDAAGPLVDKAIEAYARILERYPASRISEPEESRRLATIRAAAALGLARLRVSTQSDLRAATDVLLENRLTAPENLDATVRLHAELLRLLQQSGSPDTLVLVLEQMLDSVPAADPEGNPVSLVLDAPMQIVEIAEAQGHAEEAAARLEIAQAFFEQVLREYAGKPVAVAARLHQANILVKQGRFSDADGVFSEAVTMPRSEGYVPGILFTQATVRQQGLSDHFGAIALLRRLQEDFPEDVRAPGALLQIGIAFQATGMSDSALVAFDRVEESYPAKVDIISQAQLLAATIIEEKGEWDEALSRYRGVSARFPRTSSGLLAPLQIASHYQRAGNQAAAEATLLQAATEYERIARELGNDRSSREVVLAALDHLADVWTQLGRWEDAVQVLVTRAEDFPSDYRSPLAYVRAASIQEERLHDRKGAVATLERLTERYPDLPLAHRAKEKIETLQGS